ncbi:MAG: ABC transporter permease [Betaproteobacteria bacterium RIFCSPLOWO2_02_FULL_67_26]|nr:MAG: ABC transporter permease [Betaproteobacteria bacterium RIFCSPLOWO2_02_FULL_67_26]
MSRSTSWWLPPGTHPDAALILTARGIRAFTDGYVALLLPYYLTLLGYSAFQVGVIATATLLGSGLLTLLVGVFAHRFRLHALLGAACLMMLGTGFGFAVITDFWPLLLIAVVGTLNPSSGDVSVFLPLEQSLLTHAARSEQRTALFARYSLVGNLVGALGALAAAAPGLLAQSGLLELKAAVQVMFALYGFSGLVVFALYRRLASAAAHGDEMRSAPLGPSRGIVYRLAALFSLDAFAGGFAVQSLLALWLFLRFELSVEAAGTIFFWTGVLAAASFLAAPAIARRIGLINTMVYTHLPANVFCVLVPFMPTLPLALLFLFLRAALSSMDVPARSSYVMAVVSPGERAAAAGVTAVPRSLAAALSPAFAGYLLTLTPFGWPLVICGALKIVYDLMLLAMFRKVKPPEER